ncbi:hypothetical protein ACLQ26_05805 [Micromonospora sp. DT43]|uniref:hypothetical protein n=1 Tax=Micromonospora sp. DT43 TaxID=3393440 RepID=UPI003CF59DDD
MVEAGRVVAEAALGDVTTATVRHERLVAGDMLRAGRTLLDAERAAYSEVHDRPAVRKLVAVVWRSVDAPAGIVQLATTLGVA